MTDRKKIEIADDEMVDKYPEEVYHLISLVNEELGYGEYLITDESKLGDFNMCLGYDEIQNILNEEHPELELKATDHIWKLAVAINNHQQKKVIH